VVILKNLVSKKVFKIASIVVVTTAAIIGLLFWAAHEAYEHIADVIR